MTSILNVTCAHCLKMNKVPVERMQDGPKCGACKAALFAEHPVTASSQKWTSYIKQDLPVVVDFWASWCGPCQAMAPTFSASAKAWQGRAFFVKAETEQVPDIAAKYAIRSIPTILILHHGIEVVRQAGAMPAPMFQQWLQHHVPKEPLN